MTAAALSIPDELAPEFSLSVFSIEDEPGEVEIIIHTKPSPKVTRHASQALLYGLAIMHLDKKGVIAATINDLLAKGPISEVDAANVIACLLQEEPLNDH